MIHFNYKIKVVGTISRVYLFGWIKAAEKSFMKTKTHEKR